MTKDEFKKVVKKIRAMYPNQAFMQDKEAFDQWYAALQGEKVEVIDYCVSKYFKSSPFPPKLSDIVSQMEEVYRSVGAKKKMGLRYIQQAMVVYPGCNNSPTRSLTFFCYLQKMAGQTECASVAIQFSRDVMKHIESMERGECEYITFDDYFERWMKAWVEQKKQH